MAYIEAFFYYMGIVLFIFLLLFGGLVLLYMLFGQLLVFFSKEEVTLEIEKNFLYKLIKNRFFKWSIVAYFSAFTFFYINQASDYFSSQRAYPKAKAYAIAADTVLFWQSVGINIKLNRGFGVFYRLIRPEDKVDTKIQEVQNFFLSKMYQHIPQSDGEREMWFYKYKQLYMAKIRYLPDSIHNPHPRLSNIMDGMYNTSYKLYEKPIKDKEFEIERYLPIAQMSYYLLSNIAYYATYERSNYIDKIYKFSANKQLFQKEIDYTKLLENVYTNIESNSKVAEVFDNNPYTLGLLYGALAKGLNSIMIENTRDGIYPCGTEELEKILKNKKDFYDWIFTKKNSSFEGLGKREQKQMKSLFFGRGSNAIDYICNNSFSYINKNNIPYYDSGFLKNYVNDKDFLDDIGERGFSKYINVEKLLEEKKLHQKDK